MDSILGSENGFFAHVIDSDLVTVQIKNISKKSYVISKNFKMNHFRDFEKKKCFLTTSKNRHLIIAFANTINLRKIWNQADSFEKKNENLKTIFSNEIIVYENSETIQKFSVVTNRTSEI